MCPGSLHDRGSSARDVEAASGDKSAESDRCGAGETSAAEKASKASQRRALLLVLGHALCASCLLVVNKWALKEFPFVWTLTTVQFLFAALATYAAGKLGLIEVDALDTDRLMRFFPAAGMFFITITAGNAVVATSNVDTFIVMRSVVPIPCAILESIVLKEPLPPPRSWLGLVIVLMGAVGYCLSNQGILLGSAAWVLLYLVLMPLDGVLIKQVVSSAGLSPWGLVLYNNVCALIPGLLFSMLLEVGRPSDAEAMLKAFAERPLLVGAPILLSCCTGLAISYFQLNVRSVISSTAFMVLGVSNKILSVLLNQLARLDSNNDLRSISSVLASILGAILFQQTVKGNGLSQAPKTDPQKHQRLAQVFVAGGILAAAGISLTQWH